MPTGIYARGIVAAKHGHTRSYGKSPEYRTWWSMIQRCKHPSQRSWKWYGGRGISVCLRWQTFENFLADMGPKPDGMTLERINCDLNYEPSNCKWATPVEQAANRRGIFRTGSTGGTLSVATRKKLSVHFMNQPPEVRRQRAVAAARARWSKICRL